MGHSLGGSIVFCAGGHLAAVAREIRNIIGLLKKIDFSRCKKISNWENAFAIYRPFCYVLRHCCVSETLMPKFLVYVFVCLRSQGLPLGMQGFHSTQLEL